MELLILLFLFTLCLAIISRTPQAQKLYRRYQQNKLFSPFQLNNPPPHPASDPSKETEKTTAIQNLPPYIFPALAAKTASRTSMGLKRLDMPNWLSIDANYHSEHTLRTHLLSAPTTRENVIQCLPGSSQACHEVLSFVVSFLTSRFPQYFTLIPSPPPSSGQQIHNSLTGETYVIGEKCANPLEVAARLAMEDFNVLMKNEEGEYCLMASATLFPAGWKLQERIGTSMARLHAPVPGWKEKLGGSVSRYFDHLTPQKAMERTNLFIQISPNLFTDAPDCSPSLGQPALAPKDLYVRRERQTFRRLEKSGAVLFTVRTFMMRLIDVGVEGVDGEKAGLGGGWLRSGGREEVEALVQQVRGWDDDIRVYKGCGVWGKAWEEWCAGVGLDLAPAEVEL